MTQVVSSISGLEIYSPSAGYAPTNSGDVSAIASAYQVVSATATQLYAGTAYLTSVNDAPVSASRAGNAANASLANSAWYDGTGRLISSLPDAAEVSSIASSYAESAVSSKADASSLSSYALSSDVSGVIDTVSSNSASWGQGGVDSAMVSAIASSYAESAASSKLDTTAQVVSATAGDGVYITSINGLGLSGQGGGGGTGDYVEKSATEVTIGSNNTASATAFAQGVYNSSTGYSFAQGSGNTASSYSIAQGYANNARDCSVAFGARASAVGTAFAIGKNNLHGNGYITGHSAAFVIGDGTANTARHDLMLVTKDGEITMYSSTADTVGLGLVSAIKAISAAATGGGGVVTATGSASATAGSIWLPTTSYLVSSINGSALLPYGYSALSSNSANWTLTNIAVSANSANWNSAYSLISGVTALMDAI